MGLRFSLVGNLHVNFNVSEDVTEFVHQTTESIAGEAPKSKENTENIAWCDIARGNIYHFALSSSLRVSFADLIDLFSQAGVVESMPVVQSKFVTRIICGVVP